MNICAGIIHRLLLFYVFYYFREHKVFHVEYVRELNPVVKFNIHHRVEVKIKSFQMQNQSIR